MEEFDPKVAARNILTRHAFATDFSFQQLVLIHSQIPRLHINDWEEQITTGRVQRAINDHCIAKTLGLICKDVQTMKKEQKNQMKLITLISDFLNEPVPRWLRNMRLFLALVIIAGTVVGGIALLDSTNVPLAKGCGIVVLISAVAMFILQVINQKCVKNFQSQNGQEVHTEDAPVEVVRAEDAQAQQVQNMRRLGENLETQKNLFYG